MKTMKDHYWRLRGNNSLDKFQTEVSDTLIELCKSCKSTHSQTLRDIGRLHTIEAMLSTIRNIVDSMAPTEEDE